MSSLTKCRSTCHDQALAQIRNLIPFSCVHTSSHVLEVPESTDRDRDDLEKKSVHHVLVLRNHVLFKTDPKSNSRESKRNEKLFFDSFLFKQINETKALVTLLVQARDVVFIVGLKATMNTTAKSRNTPNVRS